MGAGETTAQRREAAAAQLVEHVDDDGTVIEVVTRAEMRARGLRHRSVYIAVVDDTDRLLVHKRADWKDVFPSCWDLAFGGVCDVGESWIDSAKRELAEEAGVTGDLFDGGPVSFDADDVALIGRLYVCRHEGPFRFDDGEVVDIAWVPLDDVAAFVAANEIPDDSAVIVTQAAVNRALAAEAGSHAGFDLRAARVRPSGSTGRATRTTAGVIVLAAAADDELVDHIEHHQHDAALADRLVTAIGQRPPAGFAMLYTSNGQPHVLAAGAVTVGVSSLTARLTIEPIEGQVVVHPLDAGPGATVTLAIGDRAPSPSALSLDRGSIAAEALTIELAGAAEPALESARAPAPEASEVPATATPTAAPASSDDRLSRRARVHPRHPAPTAAPASSDDVGLLPQLHDPATSPAAAREPIGVEQPASAFTQASGLEPSLPGAQGVTFADDEQASAGPRPIADEAALPPFDAPASPVLAPRSSEPERFAEALPGTAMVLGASCPHGHHNHRSAINCTHCGAAMPADTTTILVNAPRPSLGVVIADDGTTQAIEHDIIIGRDPASHSAVRTNTALALRLADDTLALSRCHARIVLDGWTASVADLGSSNGTWLNRRDDDPDLWNRVEPDQPVDLASGDRLRLGGRVLHLDLHPA